MNFRRDGGRSLGQVPASTAKVWCWLVPVGHPNTARNRNHRRSATANTRASTGACTGASSPSTISMRPDAASLDGSGASTTSGTDPAPLSAGVRRRHLNTPIRVMRVCEPTYTPNGRSPRRTQAQNCANWHNLSVE